MPTAPTESHEHERLAKRQFYRRLMIGFAVAGVAVSLLLREVGYPLAGEAVYWLGIVGLLAVWLGTSVRLFDERDRDIERRAAHLTLNAFAAVLVLGASTARVLTWVTSYEVPTAVWGALWGYVALFAGFGVAYVWVRYRP